MRGSEASCGHGNTSHMWSFLRNGTPERGLGIAGDSSSPCAGEEQGVDVRRSTGTLGPGLGVSSGPGPQRHLSGAPQHGDQEPSPPPHGSRVVTGRWWHLYEEETWVVRRAAQPPPPASAVGALVKAAEQARASPQRLPLAFRGGSRAQGLVLTLEGQSPVGLQATPGHHGPS